MIQASKARLVTGLHVQNLAIRHKEMDFFLLAYRRMSSLAGLLAGFASTGFMISPVNHKKRGVANIIYLLTTSASLGCQLVVLCICTMGKLWGPGMILSGQGAEAVEHALRTMELASDTALKFFLFGLFFYLASCTFYAWVAYAYMTAVILSSSMLIAMYFIFKAAFQLLDELGLVMYTSGHLRGNPMQNPRPQQTQEESFECPSESRLPELYIGFDTRG